MTLSEPSVSSPAASASAAAARSISAIASSARQRSSTCQATISRVHDPQRAPHERAHHPVAVGLVGERLHEIACSTERLRDCTLAADLLHRTVAAQPGQHDLDLLLEG